MKEKIDTHINVYQEVNLKLILQKVYQNKLFLIASVVSCSLLAFVYIKHSTPLYEISTSILIDTKGSNRALGDSQYVDGGVSLIEMEKNLYNEIGILKSFSLMVQTVQDLDFDVSYYAGNWFKKKEYYDYYPFKVTLTSNKSQLYGIPFEVKILSNEKYRLSVKGSDFRVSDPKTGSFHSVDKAFNFSKEFSFGEEVIHNYFNFVLNRPEYEVNADDFNEDELSFNINDANGLANSYMSKIEVANIDLQASIFKIVSQGPIINREIDFLKKLTENYVQNKFISRNKIASSKRAFIQNQLQVISDSLSKVEAKLELYKKNKSALNLGATARNALRQTSNLQVDMAKVQLEMNYYKSLIQSVESNRNSVDFEIPTAVGIEDPLINSNIIELKQLYDVRARKKYFVTSNNEEMRILNGQIKASTDLLLNNLKNAVKSSEYQLQRISSQLSNYDGLINSLPTRENELLTIERQSTLYENLFKYLSQELAKAGIARAESTSDTRVLDEARLIGYGPVSPNKKLIMAFGFLVGAFIPLAWIVLFSTQDTIENVNQIMTHSEIPVIASIAHHDSKSKISDSDLSLWKVKESFRDLYAKLRIINPKKKPFLDDIIFPPDKLSNPQFNPTACVLGFTSIMPEEGKTFCAINLGITLAEAGKKTLIIDVDLRNPSIVTEQNKINGKGLANYLQGNIGLLDDIIYPHEKLNNLQFIPTTILDGNIQGLLSGAKMNSVILDLKDRYDYIILDTPAVGLVSDFLLFSDVIDINLFVVRRKIAKFSFLKDFDKLVLRDKNKKSYLIFNDAMAKDYKYGYGQKYGNNKEIKLINDSLAV